MRVLILLIVVVYLIGVGVALAPVVKSKWNDGTASDFSASVVQAAPAALLWPVGLYQSLTETGEASHEPQTKTP
jgi:hypothetical protein